MLIETLVKKNAEKGIEGTQIHRNPDNLSQWFVMVKTQDRASHLLVDQDEKPITKTNIEALLSILRQAGIKSAEVIF